MMRTSPYTRALRALRQTTHSVAGTHRIGLGRGFSTSASLRDDDAGDEEAGFRKNRRAKVDPQTVEDWFRGEGLPYLNPTPGRPNWLGGDVPFPDNPAFRPPEPLSDVVRSSIYHRYIKHFQASALPESQTHVQAVRALNEQFGISIGRIEAIIRLKQYEHQFLKGKKVQHAFQKGMESYLGIQRERQRALVSDDEFTPGDINASRQRSAEIDLEASGSGERAQKAGAARRVWWELVDDAPDAQPVVPNLVAKSLEARQTRLAENRQAHAGVALHIEGKSSPQGKPHTVYTFIDTGAKASSAAKKTSA